MSCIPTSSEAGFRALLGPPGVLTRATGLPRVGFLAWVVAMLRTPTGARRQPVEPSRRPESNPRQRLRSRKWRSAGKTRGGSAPMENESVLLQSPSIQGRMHDFFVISFARVG